MSSHLANTELPVFFQNVGYVGIGFLGHLSHSGDLLLWVGVRRRPSSIVRRPLTSSSQELPGQS